MHEKVGKMLKRKVHTLITNPVGVLVKYTRWNKLIAHLRGLLPPNNNENYDKHWNYASFKDKIVLDLGADYGSTASYFLWRGAKQVIAVEGSKEFADALRKNFENNPKVIPIELFIKSPVDIEEYELTLLNCQNLQKVKE